MKSPFAKPEVPPIPKMEHCDKVSDQTSPKKPPPVCGTALKPSCVKAITFDSCEDLSSLNKENRAASPSCSLLGCGELQEDSGYVTPVLGGGGCSPVAAVLPAEPSPAEPKLPALQFQRAVCRELRKGFQRTGTYDWAVVHALAGQFGLHNVVGGEMGLEHLDVLQGLLEKGMRHILTWILALLDDVDLVNCKRVSRAWRRVISGDPRAQRRCWEAEQRLRDSRKLGAPLSRNLTVSRGVFTPLQHLASTPIQTPHRQVAQRDRFLEFQEVAGSLKQHEALRSCQRCRSPALVDSALRRAACTRQSCEFVSCTLCHASYHGSAPCPSARRSPGQSHATPRPGRAPCKHTLRRL
ncbi:F-box only protein 5 [Conger conger]|uniref:F-box only protein 5 n=1 Tax=Conger conger TaxID=82655 RepID=UPI002A5A1E99|nr:F-box only protein 5 [Conger conger]